MPGGARVGDSLCRGAGALIGVLLRLVCWCLQHTSLFRMLENEQFDGCFVFRGPRPTSGQCDHRGAG